MGRRRNLAKRLPVLLVAQRRIVLLPYGLARRLVRSVSRYKSEPDVDLVVE